MKRRKISRPRRRAWVWVDAADQKITLDLVGDTAFAIVDGRRIASSQFGNWRWVGLTGGRHAALLRELNRPNRPPASPRPVR